MWFRGRNSTGSVRREKSAKAKRLERRDRLRRWSYRPWLEELEQRVMLATDITISTSATAGGAFVLMAGEQVFVPAAATATVNVADVEGFLNAGTSVRIDTTSAFGNPGNIVMLAGTAIDKTAGADAMLTLSANNDLGITQAINSTSNDLNLAAAADNDAAGGGTLTLSANIDSNGGAVTLSSGGALAINQSIDAGANTVRLQAAGTITQAAAGVVTADELGIRAGGAVTLCAATNDVNVLAINTTGLIEFRDGDNLTVGAVAAGALGFAGAAGLTGNNNNINLNVGTSLAINQPINAGIGDARLVVGTTVSQSAAGVITADELGITAAGAVTLCAATNDVNTLAVNTTGLIEFRDGDGLTIGTVAAGGGCGFAGADGLVSVNNSINLNVGSLNATRPINAGLADERIVAATTVTQAAAGIITANELGIVAGGAVTLGAATNDVDLIAVNTTGLIEFRDGDDLTVSTVVAGGGCGFAGATGLVSTNNNINLNIGSLNLAQAINAGTGDVRVVSPGFANQSAAGVITADELGVTVGGAVTLAGAANDVNILAIAATGLVEFNDTDDLTIGTVAAGGGAGFAGATGVMSGGGNVNLTAGGNVQLNQQINAGAGNVQTIAGGAITVAVDINANDVALTAGTDLAINVSQTPDGNFTAEAGNTLTLPASQSITVGPGQTINLEVDTVGMADPAGGTANILGNLVGPGGATLAGGSEGDTFNVALMLANLQVNGQGGNDTLVLADGASLGTGVFDGGDGTDTLDYSDYTTAVAVNLGSNVSSLVATLQGDQEVPATPSTATGNATITYNNTAHTIDIALTVNGIAPTDPGLRFHVHRAPTGVNGPIIVDLFNASPPSSLGTLTPTGPTSFTFTATNVPLNSLHEAALLGGITYVNVHTAAFPGGEIRGQVFPNALFVAAAGTATNTGGVTGVENATGGAGADSIVGDNGVNILRGGGGNDVLVGGRGNDSIEGGVSIGLLGLTTGNALVSFDADDPATILATNPITGLVGGENVIGIDVRPSTGQLYGVTDQSRLYTINPSSGAATLVASLTNAVGGGAVTLTGTAFGVDFNPVPDRLRVVSDTDQNLRINPDNGVTNVDGTLIYDNTTADGDPIDSNAGANPNVGGVAYTNSFPGATTTTLYDIDSALDILANQNPPNNGVLNTIGPLGVNTSDLVGFDIFGARQALASLTAPAAVNSTLYTINLATGAATVVGAIAAAPLRGLTVASVGSVGSVGSVLEDEDILVWSNGDGTDVMDGGPGTDLVNVNGNPTAADVFTIGAGPGGRVNFDRLSPAPFSLDIGTTETLSVIGIAGSDSFTVNSLAGVADLTAVNLNGLDGNDTFNVTPAATVTVNVAGHQPRTAPGDTLNYNGSGNVNPSGPGSGSITQAGVQNVNFTGIESVTTAITVTVQAGNLIIEGTSDDDIVTITGIPSGVAGSGMYLVTTQQGSQPQQTQNVSGVAGDIRVNLRAGNDQLTMNNVYVNGSIIIDMESGNDTITLGNADVVSTRGDLDVDLGTENDVLNGKRIFIAGNQILVGGDGNDTMTFDGFASPFTLGTSAAGNANWSTGNGDDTVHVIYAFIVGAFAIDLGVGTDSLDIFGSAASGNVSFFGGTGIDSLTVDTNFFDANLLLDGGADNDSVFLANGLGIDIGTINTGAGDDTVTVRNETEGRANIDTGSGDDTVDVRSSAVDRFFALLGEDDDQLTLFGNLLRLEADLDGGPGSADRLLDLGNDVRGALRTRNFELFA
jgi:hypothetical protein